MDALDHDQVATSAQVVEQTEVHRWRFDQFIRLGFDDLRASLMADAPVDLAAARRLIALGCPLETASRILI